MTLLLGLSGNTQGYLADTVALAAVALIGYLLGYRTRKQTVTLTDIKLSQELSVRPELPRSFSRSPRGFVRTWPRIRQTSLNSKRDSAI